MKFEVGTTIQTKQPFQLDVSSVITGRTFIASITRFGKSWTARKIVEKCFGHAGIVLIDVEGEYVSLREKYPFLIIGKDVPIQLETAEFLVDRIIDAKLSVIIDLSKIEEELGKEYIDKFLRRLFFLETALRLPYLVIAEEAEDEMPEKGIATATCLNIFRNLAKKGGKRGIGLMVIAHRPAWVNKGVLSQCENKAIGRMDWPADLAVIEEYLRIPSSTINKLPDLQKGEFLFAGDWVEKPTFVKVGQVETTHLGCYTTDVRVLTPMGAKIYSECKEGDYVWSLNIKTGFMEQKQIKKIFVYDYEGCIHRIRGKRANISVTPNHKMIIKTLHTPLFRFEEAGKSFSRWEFYVPNTAQWVGYVPTLEQIMPECSESRSNKLPQVDLGDLLELTGWFIAEGFISKARKTSASKTMTQICSPLNDKQRASLELLLKKMGIPYNSRSDSIRISSRKLCSYFDQFGKGAHNKHVPENFLSLTKPLLQRLFDGLMKGDGWNHNNGATKGLACGYATVSEQLAYNIFEIALKLGLQPRLKQRPPREIMLGKQLIRSGISWEVFFVRYARGHVRKANFSTSPYTGKVWCFEIADNNNMLVIEKGTAMFCGNSTPNVIPPTPKELQGVLSSLQKALPEVIEKIKPTVVPIDQIKTQIKDEMDKKYQDKIAGIQRTADEKAERKYHAQIEQLKENNDKLSRSSALQATAPIADVFDHPVVRTRMGELNDKANDLLRKIHGEPGLTRQQLAAFLTTSTDGVANLIEKINDTFRAKIVVGEGKPMQYTSQLVYFFGGGNKKEVQELEQLQRKVETQATLLDEKTTTINNQSTIISDLKKGVGNVKTLEEQSERQTIKIKKLESDKEKLIQENRDLLELGKTGEALFAIINSVIDRKMTIFKPLPTSGNAPIQAPSTADMTEVAKMIDEKIKNLPQPAQTPLTNGDVSTSVTLEHKVTHFDFQKQEEHVKADTTSLQGRIIYLITKDFFAQRHNPPEVATELANNGWSHDKKDVAEILVSLCQIGIFQRKFSTGNYWWYSLTPEAKERIHT